MENFNCPQFVDFTSPEAFELNDGADYCFGNILFFLNILFPSK